MSVKSALITGSTSGIGLEIARKLASNGYNIVINGIATKDQSDAIITDISTHYGVKCIFHSADMADPDSIESMISTCNNVFGGVDVLVNNAGIQYVSPIDEFPREKLESIIRIDLLASFYTIGFVLPYMKKKKWGRIINISSAHGLVASPFKAPYVAAKHGLIGLSKSVALEVAEFGITVNSICPGYVKTPLVIDQIASSAKTRGISEEEVVRDVMLGEQATKKFVETSEVASLVFFLCGEDAKSITGSAITIDGGWTAH